MVFPLLHWCNIYMSSKKCTTPDWLDRITKYTYYSILFGRIRITLRLKPVLIGWERSCDMAGWNQKRRLFLSTTRFQDAGGPNGSGGEPTHRLQRVSPLIMKIITIIKIIETNGRLVSIILNHTLRHPLYSYNHIYCTFNIGDCLGKEGGEHRDRYLE